jgi:DNA-directed RNA polymerase specialized sigma24 family protein
VAGWDADQAVAALYREHYRSLTRIAALLLDDSELAEEITQDAFVSLFRASGRLRDGGEALRYLRRAVISLARSQAAASPGQLGLPPGLAVGQRPAASPAGAAFMDAFRGLLAHQREALVLRYYAGWPDPQIAAAMGNQQTCAQCLHPARHVRPPGPCRPLLGWRLIWNESQPRRLARAAVIFVADNKYCFLQCRA